MGKETTNSIEKFLLISQQPFLCDLNLGEKNLLSNSAKIMEFKRGECIYHEKAPKDFVYIIVKGQIELYSLKKNKKKVIHILRTGDIIGLISTMTERNHSCSARALNDIKVIAIKHDQFREILKKSAALSVYVSKILSKRVRGLVSNEKKLYENNVVTVFSPESSATATKYSKLLKEQLEQQGKKVAAFSVNKKKHSGSLLNKQIDRVSQLSFIDKYAAEKDIVILDIQKDLTAIEEKIFSQTDSCHLITSEDQQQKETRKLLKKGLIKENIVDIDLRRISKQRVQTIARKMTGQAIGLALGSGGALGLAQIGVLEALEKEKVTVDMIAGTSMGSIISSFWALGYKAKQIQKIFQEYQSKRKTLGLFDFTFSRRGFVNGKNIRTFLNKHFGQKTFSDTNIPLNVIACDIDTRQEVVLCQGSIVDAVMASIAIPGIIKPVQTKKGQVLVDGGIIDPVPVSVLSKNGIKRVIAVNSMPSPEDKMKNLSNDQMVLDVMINSFYSMQYMIGKHVGEYVDLYLHPILENSAWHEFYRVNEFVVCGRESVYKKIKELKLLLK